MVSMLLLWSIHWFFELAFIFVCCQFTISFVRISANFIFTNSFCVACYGKPAVRIRSSCLSHVGILITGFLANLFTIESSIIWVIKFALKFYSCLAQTALGLCWRHTAPLPLTANLYQTVNYVTFPLVMTLAPKLFLKNINRIFWLL